MADRWTSYTQEAKKSLMVSYTCENCGKFNYLTHEVKGKGKLSYKGEKYDLSPTEATMMQTDALNNVEHKIGKIRLKASKGIFTWLDSQKCEGCKRYQSWQKGRIWKDFLLLLLIATPIALFILFGIMNAVVLGVTKSGSSPAWSLYIYAGFTLLIVVLEIKGLVSSLNSIDKQKHSLPTINV